MRKCIPLVALGVFLWCLSAASTPEPRVDAEVPVKAVSIQSMAQPSPVIIEYTPKEEKKKPEPSVVLKVCRVRTVMARVSAYCPCARCCRKMDGITASGSSAWRPGIACDWNWLPRGTKVHVPGYGTHRIDDKGGLLKRRHWRCGTPRLDVRFKYHWQARRWGVKYLRVEIYQ